VGTPVTATVPALELDAVEIARGGRTLVADLSFRLNPGQLALATGPNGSGKTSLLRTVAGLTRPNRGAIRIGGRPVATLEPEERALIIYQGHLDGLKKDLTVQENILFNSQVRGQSHSISSTLAELGLDGYEHRSLRHLSAGQKRRVALASLKLAGASLWLLDEPLTNLDPAGRKLVSGWLDQHLAADGMAIVATHLAEELTRPGCLLVEL
jgi:heme exporter protein A